MIQALQHGNYYHIYNRGINSATLFKEKPTTNISSNFSNYTLNQLQKLFAWCLMKNHFHFIVRIKETSEIDSDKTVILHKLFFKSFQCIYESI